jgi:hypothetical protein
MPNASITSTYVGQFALPYVAPAILSADSIAKKYVDVRQNVKKKEVLRKISGGAVQAASCSFAVPGSGQVTIADVVLETTALKVNEQICNQDLRNAWESQFMRGQKSATPAELQNFIAQQVAKEVAKTIEYNIWQGNYDADGSSAGTAAYTNFNGICKLIVDATPTFETLVTAAFSTANILANMVTITATSIPDALKGDLENTKIYMSRASHALYWRALADVYNTPFLAESMVNTYLGYQIVTPAGFPNDTLVVSRAENMVFGTNLLSDHVQASFVDMLATTGDDSTRMVMQFDGGVQIVDIDSLGVVRRSS